MTGVSDAVWSALRRQLEGEALAFVVEHEAKLRELTRAEVVAFARPFVWVDVDAIPSALMLRLSVAWRRTDAASWRAWRNGTTAALQGVAQRRAEARRLLLEAVLAASGLVLRTIGAALRGRLGL